MYLSFNSRNAEDQADVVSRIEACACEIDNWMTTNKLKLNRDKSELLVISSKFRPRPPLDSISVNDHSVLPSDFARNLGVAFDNTLSFEKQVNLICKSCFYHIRRIAKIREYLSDDSTATLIHAFISCRLDYGNALLYGLPKHLIQKLQSVQNCAARLITRNNKYAHITPILKELHWLPVEQRIVFKILLLVYKSLNNLAPKYISDLLRFHDPGRNLRSVNKLLLTVPKTKQKTYGDRAFSVAAPKLWNTLPIEIKQCSTINIFKQRLKTHLFRLAYM